MFYFFIPLIINWPKCLFKLNLKITCCSEASRDSHHLCAPLLFSQKKRTRERGIRFLTNLKVSNFPTRDNRFETPCTYRYTHKTNEPTISQSKRQNKSKWRISTRRISTHSRTYIVRCYTMVCRHFFCFKRR